MALLVIGAIAAAPVLLVVAAMVADDAEWRRFERKTRFR